MSEFVDDNASRNSMHDTANSISSSSTSDSIDIVRNRLGALVNLPMRAISAHPLSRTSLPILNTNSSTSKGSSSSSTAELNGIIIFVCEQRRKATCCWPLIYSLLNAEVNSHHCPCSSIRSSVLLFQAHSHNAYCG